MHDPVALPPTLRRQLQSFGLSSIQPVPPGMSGAVVVRCTSFDGQQMALKQWPRGTTRSRVEQVHRLMQLARDNGCPQVPKLYERRDGRDRCTTLWSINEVFWELAQWMPGSPADSSADVSQIEQGAAAIARFHASLRPRSVVRQVPPAAVQRLNRIQELDPILRGWADRNDTLRWIAQQEMAQQGISDRESAGAALVDQLHQSYRLLQMNWGSVSQRIKQSMSHHATREIQLQYVLRDVHREHVLYVDRRVSGIIDFDAIRVDTPSADLARWVGGFLVGRQDTESAWRAAVAGFRSQRVLMSGPEQEIDPTIARDLCFATTWISLANWLVWILEEKRSFPAGPEAVARRLRELTQLASQFLAPEGD